MINDKSKQQLSIQSLKSITGGRDKNFRPYKVSKLDDSHPFGFQYLKHPNAKYGFGKWRNWYG